MVHGNLIAFGGLFLGLVVCQSSCFGQDGTDSTTNSPKTPLAASTPEIPIDLLRKIVLGRGVPGEVKADLSADQIQAMKKIAASYAEDELKLNQIRGTMTFSKLKNRRFTAAVEQVKLKHEAALLKAWLEIVTPDQQAAIRRGNRQAIQAGLRRQQTPPILDDNSPIDVLMTNNDLLSVVERPAIQDLLDLTDSQVQVIEEQKALAELDAEATIHQAMDIFARPQAAPLNNQAYERMLAETRKILTAEQWSQYEKQQKDSQRTAKLIQQLGYEKALPLIMPHGLPARISTRIENGKATVEASLHNAFALPGRDPLRNNARLFWGR